jgi:DNA polymerase III sliding clamp (beta) subunit (PCNA family)
MCRLIDGKYPNYEAVYQKKIQIINDWSFSFESVRRVAIFSNNAPNSFKIAGAELNVSQKILE